MLKNKVCIKINKYLKYNKKPPANLSICRGFLNLFYKSTKRLVNHVVLLLQLQDLQRRKLHRRQPLQQLQIL